MLTIISHHHIICLKIKCNQYCCTHTHCMYKKNVKNQYRYIYCAMFTPLFRREKRPPSRPLVYFEIDIMTTDQNF